MAMNFKVFKDKDTVAVYAADIIRKQFNNNPTTIAGFHLSEEEAPVLDYLKRNVNDHAVDFSQIHILDYDKQASYFKALGIPEKQIHEIPEEDEVEKFIEHKAKTKDNKGKLTLQVVSINNKGEFGVPVNNGLKPAREIFVVVTGSDKADVIKKLYEDNGNTSFIPSSLKTHRMVNVILDEAAAQGLPDDVREYFTSLYA
ncbi:glucosamine-6-phosphate isomerase [Staphylococcus agnetis]|uniref:Glucosamine-6-phosphate isomerase n=1 Tax=Staphylococcus agnetis TaxID=985762 RepID=A0ABD7TUZ7_9STAP|nr:glucosamine-6-phosphate isomerase [Staphylococcus agnetis]UXU58086.1 glucosamine-6-phosphate isomerase [Staphylococcus agnetis]